MPVTDKNQQIELVRLKKRSEYVYVRGGLSERRRTVVVQARGRKDSGHIGLGFTATKKIGGAVTRNRAKRRLREAARALLPIHGIVGID
ncbi:MAG: ribonuclease P protein component, partial [Pseudomonadota bacterium]